jgi:hypothetical protein
MTFIGSTSLGRIGAEVQKAHQTFFDLLFMAIAHGANVPIDEPAEAHNPIKR